MNTNKADRPAYEVEIVGEAEKALQALHNSLEEGHAAAMAKQNEITAESEHARRTELKREAEEGEKKAREVFAEKKEQQAAAKKAVQSMHKEVKEAEKELKHAELLNNEYSALKEGTSQEAAGKKAVKKLES